MLKIMLASLIIGATSTVSLVELYSWNQFKSEVETEQAPQTINTYTVDGNSAYMEKNEHYIKYLRLEIDGLDNMRLLSESNVPGEWVKRTHRFGAKLYYEVKDQDGRIISTGYRADPRSEKMSSSDARQAYPFVVSLPYMPDASNIVFYRMDNDYSQENSMGFDYVKLQEYNFSNRL